MGAAFYIVLEREIPNFTHLDVDGKTVARNSKQLARAARKLKLPRLDDYLSSSREQIEEFLEPESADSKYESRISAHVPDEKRAQLEKINRDANRFFSQAQRAIRFLRGLTFAKAPVEQWFEAGTALSTVHGLIDYIQAHPGKFDASEQLIRDLQRYIEILEVANVERVRFHLAVDY